MAYFPISLNDDNPNQEVGALCWLFLGLISFVVSGFMSCHELNYQMRGETTDALITRFKHLKRTHQGREYTETHVHYSWTQRDAVTRADVANVGAFWTQPESGTISIDYLPGRKKKQIERSRAILPHRLFHRLRDDHNPCVLRNREKGLHTTVQWTIFRIACFRHDGIA